MKKEFYGYYEPTEEEINFAWEKGIFVFDTNTLLNLYRYTESTRMDFLLALNKLALQLHMPYQVGLEYHKNRRKTIENLNTSYKQLEKAFTDKLNSTFLDNLKGYNRHPVINISKLGPLVTEFLKKINTEITEQQKSHPDFLSNDEIREELNKLFENKVGHNPTDDALKKLQEIGNKRYEQKIPPGYKDRGKQKQKEGENDPAEQDAKGDDNIYGDLVIWFSLIDLSKATKQPIVFVTDDRKQDWWEMNKGIVIGPRQELTKEFFDETGRRILIYTPGLFLKLVKERKIVEEIKEASIAEIIEVRKADVKTEEYIEAREMVNSLSERKIINPARLNKSYLEEIATIAAVQGISPSALAAIKIENAIGDYRIPASWLGKSNSVFDDPFFSPLRNSLFEAKYRHEIDELLEVLEEPVAEIQPHLNGEPVIKEENTDDDSLATETNPAPTE